MDPMDFARSARRQRDLLAQAAPEESSDPAVAAKLEEVRRLREELDAAQQMETDGAFGADIGETLRKQMMGQ